MSDTSELKNGSPIRYAITFTDGITPSGVWQAFNYNSDLDVFDGSNVVLFNNKAAAKKWFRDIINQSWVSDQASAELFKTSEPFIRWEEDEPEELWFVSPFIRNGERTVTVWKS